MPPSLRALLLPLLLSLVPLDAQAQPARPGDLAGLVLEPDARYSSHLEAARERIGKKDWAIAVTLLQRLLDLPGERFAVVGKDGKERVVSLRWEAERLLANLPKEGRDYYEKEFGPPAADLLKRARTLNEPAMLAEVVHRYLFTKAGLMAALRLGAHYVDAGRMRQAAIVYDALDRRRLGSWWWFVDEVSIYKAARAYHAAGDDDRAARFLTLLKDKLDTGALKVGKRTLSFADIKKELKKQPRKTPAALTSWPVFRGDVSRSAEGVGGAPVLRPRWRFDTWREQSTRRFLDQAERQLRSRKRSILPALYPLSATLVHKDAKIPLMVYRDFWGLHTRPLRDVGDPKAGDFCKAGALYWEAPSAWSIDRMAREPRHSVILNDWIQQTLTGGGRPEALFDNSVVGSLSTDNVRVYINDDFQLTPPDSPFNRPGGKLGDALHHNLLQAYDLNSGKLLWEDGGRHSKAPHDLRDSFFLAPPLPLDGKLLVPVEKKGELHVVTLDPATGKVLDWLRLAAVRDKVTDNPLRRSHAAHLAYADGVLVCPTNAGTLLGVDLEARTVLWAHGYREVIPPSTPPSDRFGRPPPGTRYTPDGRLVPLPGRAEPWTASAPILRDGKVVFTAPDGEAVYCLRLRNGELLWRYPRQDGDAYLAGVLGGKVLIVGRKSCRALGLDDGKEVWTLDTGLPSGMGIAAGNRYFLPLESAIKTREPEICVIDVARGQVFAHTRSRSRSVPGNLLLFEDCVLSQNLREVAAYPQLAAELKRADALLARNAKDPNGLMLRGDLRLDRGDLKGAAEDYRTALKGRVEAALADRLRTRLYETLADYFLRDFDAAEKYLAAFEAACRLEVPGGDAAAMQRVRAERARRLGTYYALLGRGRERQKKFVAAAKAYLDLLEQGRLTGLMEVPGDPGLRVAATVWVRRRIGTLLEKASPKERAQIEKEIERRLRQGKGRPDGAGGRALFGGREHTAR